MCSINGCVDFIHPERVNSKAAEVACFQMRRRGPDGSGHFDAPGVSLWHNRLAVMDPAGGKQPMSVVFKGQRYTVVYNGEIYNTAELRQTLAGQGAVFLTACDTEVVLWSYIVYGKDCPKHLNGIFSFAVCEEGRDLLFVARDRLGVKPFFYTVLGSSFYFASEIKGLLAHPEIPP
ncbi:MAG: asparagine synthetase B, partial [Ruminococcaceae bacterium]|nr:asparagine synthetase B [Oscillospiraceae bacterium]